MDEVTGVVKDAAADIVPKNLVETIEAFSATLIGGFVLKVMLIAVVLLIMMIAVRCTNRCFMRAIDRMKKAGNSSATLLSFVRYIAIAVIYFTAFTIIISNIPVLNAGVNKLLAAGGILAVVLGVASQEALGAVASGVMLLLFKPFTIGDVVNVLTNGVCGTVEDITLRHTVLKTMENKRVMIPNNMMNSAIIENFDYGEKRVCLTLDIGVTYETDLQKALAVLAEEVAKHPGYVDVRTAEELASGAPLVNVRVQQLAESSVVLRAFLWGKDNGTAIVLKTDLMRLVKERFDAEGIRIAYPHLVIVSK